jgi:N-methylhydantoinase A
VDLGGKSIAYLDDDHQLQLSSPSTATNTNPACYGLGDDQPTITDANLILGRLPPNTIIGNAIRVDRNAARMAVAKISGPLNKSIEDAALAIINHANAKIITPLQAFLNQHSCEETQVTLCAVGGCGGLHLCAIADALNIKNALVPVFSGVFSAFSMLASVKNDWHLPTLDHHKNRATHHRTQLYDITLPVSVWRRSELSPEEMIMGPAIITESTTTIFIQNGWLAYVDAVGNLLLRRMAIDVY